MTSRVKGIALAMGLAPIASAAVWHTLGPDSSIAEHDGAVGAGPCSSPTASLGVSATPGDGEVTVRWSSINPINQHGIIFYEVRYKRGSSGSWRHGWSGSSRTSATIGGLNAGVAYDFRVRAGEFVDGNECLGPWWSDSAVPKTTVSFSASSYTVNEGSSRNIGVRLSSAPGGTLSIPITVSPGTDRTATFTSGSTSASFNYAAPQDADCDDERINLSFGTLPSWVMTGSPSSATLTVRNDDSPCETVIEVSFSASSYAVNEGSSRSVTVRLSGSSSRRLTIPVTVSNGTAEGGDYEVLDCRTAV